MAEWTHLENMEKELYVDNAKLEYEGLFSHDELMRLIDDWAKRHDYYKEIKAHKEKVTPHGRNITMGIDLQRPISHIHFSVIVVEVEIEGMKDEIVELDGVRTKVNEGEIEMVFNGYLYQSLKERWETKPNVAFVRRVIDKFVYKLERAKYPGTVVAETKDLMNQIRAFLNLYKHRIKHHGHGEEAAEATEAHGGHGKEETQHGEEAHGSASQAETGHKGYNHGSKGKSHH